MSLPGLKVLEGIAAFKSRIAIYDLKKINA